ncbi:carbon-nitrogen family hydrolase [Methanocalculus taiwanensis]|uniref:Carbon-nitrogen family hydrolase n=2 Tax=Methanocalculus taiwanensis TaxID=106207 RepID=A0ABD4TNL7_9EURY|nr:carbon-nitrogen family hydrolase [Methanocalculus taiwanensis]
MIGGEKMDICCAQLGSVFEKPAANLARAEDAVKKAVAYGSDLIVFPEQYPTGWDPASSLSAEGREGPIAMEWCRIAEEYGAWIVGSHREQYGEKLLNTALLIGHDGVIHARYSKLHLFSPSGEDRLYSKGDAPVVFSCHGVSIGLAICYDLRFPELFRRYADVGAECIIVPAAWPCSRLKHFNLFLQSRAIENQFYVAGICSTGRTPVDHYCGGSMIVDPRGEILCRAGEDEALISAVIDPAVVHESRRLFPILKDRRQDIR